MGWADSGMTGWLHKLKGLKTTALAQAEMGSNRSLAEGSRAVAVQINNQETFILLKPSTPSSFISSDSPTQAASRQLRVRKIPAVVALSLSTLLTTTAMAQKATTQADAQRFKDIYKELIEIDTSLAGGRTTEAANAMRERLLAAGMPAADMEVIEPFPKHGNLVARYRGTGEKKPILLLAHIDVVNAKREEWKTDPFKLTETDGRYIARGAIDDKAMSSAYVSIFDQLRREGFKPKRDIIMALTAAEESGGDANGAAWLAQNARDKIDAEFGINEGGRGEYRGGKAYANLVQVSEKATVLYKFEAKGPGGHSARPTLDNTIYDLSEALARLRQYRFPVDIGPNSRSFFEKSAALQPDDLKSDFLAVAAGNPSAEVTERLSNRPTLIGLLRNTCVATTLTGGHATNALAQTATATVNCRLLPGADVALVDKKLAEIAGDKVTVTRDKEPFMSPASPLLPQFFGVAEKLSAQMWPGVPLVPTQGVSSTDSRFMRSIGIPMYGVSGLFVDPEKTGVHGLNENVGIKELMDMREFLYQLIKKLASE